MVVLVLVLVLIKIGLALPFPSATRKEIAPHNPYTYSTAIFFAATMVHLIPSKHSWFPAPPIAIKAIIRKRTLAEKSCDLRQRFAHPSPELHCFAASMLDWSHGLAVHTRFHTFGLDPIERTTTVNHGLNKMYGILKVNSKLSISLEFPSPPRRPLRSRRQPLSPGRPTPPLTLCVSGLCPLLLP